MAKSFRTQTRYTIVNGQLIPVDREFSDKKIRKADNVIIEPKLLIDSIHHLLIDSTHVLRIE